MYSKKFLNINIKMEIYPFGECTLSTSKNADSMLTNCYCITCETRSDQNVA